MEDLLQTIWDNLTDITIGSFLIIDLIAATTNAFNGALLARRPDHYKHFTVVGIVLLAVIGVVGPTAGRWLIDIVCGLTPKHLVRGEWFVGTAVLTSAVYIVCYYLDLSIWPATLIAVAAGFAFRLLALFRIWEEPEPWQPAEQHVGETPRRALGEALQAARAVHD